MRSTLAVLVVALAPIACGDVFTPYSEVDSLRVLAMRATPPWPAPGEIATLDALVVSPSGEDVSYAWSWCPLVGSASAGYPCLVDEQVLRAELDAEAIGSGVSLPAFDRGTDPTATLPHTLSPLLWQHVCGLVREQTREGSALDCLSAFPVTVLLTVRTATAQVRAKKTVRLKYDATVESNDNPTVSGLVLERPLGPVTLDDAAGTLVAPDTTYDLRLDLPETAAESVTEPDGSVSRERLLFTWFKDVGTTDQERTTFIDGEVPLDTAARNTWTTPLASEVVTNPATFWVVAHDSRGGVAWTSGRATIEVPQ